MTTQTRIDLKEKRSRRAAGFTWLLTCLAFLLMTVPATAGTILPGQYFLLDHPNGAISPPPYGLRMDSLGYTFSAELNGASLVLTWNGGNTADIAGTLWNNQTAELWTVDFELTGVTAVAGNLGFRSTGGTGSLTDPLLNAVSLTGKQDGSGSAFTFLADGHRLAGDSDSPVARGWVQGSGVNDFLTRAIPVPEPTTALLLGLGLISLAAHRRRERGPQSCGGRGAPGTA